MNLSASDDTVKKIRVILLVLSMVYFFIALIVIGASLFLYIDKSDLLSFVYMMNVARPACIMVLAAGCATIFVSLLGALAAGLQNKYLLAIYALFVLVVAATSVIGGILAISGRTQWTDHIRQKMREVIQTQYGINVSTNAVNAFTTQQWDYAQRKWYCCAIEDNSWGVYRSSVWYDQQPGNKENDRPLVPPSCCTYDQYGAIINQQKCQIWADGPPRTQSSRLPNEALLYKGCYTYGTELLQRVMSGLIAMGIILAVLLCFGFLLAAAMFLSMRKQEKIPPVIRQTAFAINNPSFEKNANANGVKYESYS